MGGRGGAGRSRRTPQHLPQDPVLPPDATFRPDEEPTEVPPTEQDRDEAAEANDTEAGGLESTIRSAYEELAVKKQDWVRLSTLREKLGNPEPAEMDRILRDMIRTGRVHLAPDSDRKSLTDADHAAAIRIGDQDKHLIAIEPPDDDPYWR